MSSDSDILSPKVTPPIPTHMVEAEYPYSLKSSGVEGRVDVSCLIDENGAVVEASILRAANIDFVSSALEAVKEWRFAPGTHNNKPVPMRIVIPFQFNFEHEDPRFSR